MATENKMGVMPLNRLLISMSVPMMISMLVQALYNIVDSMFVAQLSENALTAVSLAFPAQNLMIAVATGTGVGVNAALSRNLGEKNFERANKIADHALFLAALSYVVFALFGLCFARQFFCLQTDIEEIVDLGTTYLRVCTIASFGLFMEIACERLLQSTGKTIYSMYTQGLGAIINIVLDPILIFGYFGAPALGIAGAAGATVIGQIIAFCLGFFFNKTRNHEITISLRDFKPNSEIISHIYAVGIPSIIMASIGSVMTFGMNKILIAFSSTATAVFGIYFKLQSFVFMPVFGLNNGTVPIIAYNYGAGKPDRIMGTLKLAAMYAVTIMLIGLAVVQLIPDKLLMIFSASDTMLSIGIPDHLPELPVRRILHRLLFHVPGAWSRHAELMDLRVPSAGRSSPGRICFCETRRTSRRMVRIPDRRSFRDHFQCSLPRLCVSERNPSVKGTSGKVTGAEQLSLQCLK